MIHHLTTFEAYNDQVQIIKRKQKPRDCFICYENINNITPIRIRNNCYYQKNCNCDVWIHKKCLDCWYNIKKSCPICRISINKNSNMLVKIYKTNYNLFLLIIFIKTNVIKINNNRAIKNILYTIFLISFLCKLYQFLIMTTIDEIHEIYKY